MVCMRKGKNETLVPSTGTNGDKTHKAAIHGGFQAGRGQDP
jgi:hypothetical protein